MKIMTKTTPARRLRRAARPFAQAVAAGIAVSALGPATWSAAAPSDAQRHEVSASIRSAADDVLSGDGKAYASPETPTFLLDQGNPGREDVLWLFSGKGRPFWITVAGKRIACEGLSSVAFWSATTPDWYGATAEPASALLGDAGVTCRPRNGASSDGYRVRYPGTPGDPAAECFTVRRMDTSGPRAYEITPREASPGRKPQPAASHPLEPVGALLGEDDAHQDPGEPPTPGCDARIYEVVRSGNGNYTERLVAEGPAPFLIRAQVAT